MAFPFMWRSERAVRYLLGSVEQVVLWEKKEMIRSMLSLMYGFGADIGWRLLV